MNSYISCILLSLVLLPAAMALPPEPPGSDGNEQWLSLVDGFQEGSSPELTVLESTQDHIVLRVVLPGFWLSSRRLGGSTYQNLNIPEGTFTTEVGCPQLPVVHALVAVPFDSQPTLRLRSSTETVLPGYLVYPCQPPVFDSVVPQAEPVLACTAGQDMPLYPAQVVSLSPPGVWRDLNVVRIDLFMVQYDQAAQSLTVSNDVVVEIQYPGGRGLFQDPHRAISPEFDAMYSAQVLNYASLRHPAGADGGRTGPQYLIITHPNFAAAIQPLTEWRQRVGMDTEVVSITTTNPQVIKDTIVNRYNEGDLEYVLLVGDPGYVPIATWDSLASDYWYSCLTGSPPDLYADIAIGRLSVTSSAQADHQVTKILDYLTGPPLDTPWLTKTLLVAHMAGGVYEYRACKEYIRSSIIPGTAFSASTAYGDTMGVTNALVTARINAGQGIVNYRGHGLTSLWWQWNIVPEDWTTTNVYALDNGGYTPIVFNIACENNRIQDAAESLGEAWMNKYPGGAVASLGATDDGVTYPNQTYDKQLYDQFCQQGEYHLGWISNAAATYTLIHDPTYAPWNVKMFLWLGDPALELWTKMPGSLSVMHPETVPVGASEFSASVSADGAPLDGALVCLWKDSEVYETQETADGIATFTVTPATAGTLAVTVTKHDFLPYASGVTVLDFLPGDVNGDGVVNGYDIDPFVFALTLGETEFLVEHPTWHYWAADCNQDGSVNGFDIDPFVILLTGH